jgi:hypothetical protein
MAARPNPQVWYASSAGKEDSEVLARVKKRGEEGSSGRLAYFEWSAPADADLDDPQAWASANPGLGIRIEAEFVEAERSALPEIEFARERLGIWADGTRDAAIDLALWTDLADTECQDRSPVVFCPTINPERTKGAITAAILRGDGLVQVESIDYRPGTAWMPDRLLALNADWRPAAIVVDPGAAEGSLIQGLQAAGIEPVLMTGREAAQADGAFYDALVDRRIRHGNQAATNIAVEQATWRPVGDTRVFHRRSAADIGPLSGAAKAFHVVSRQPEQVQPFFASWR